jgi:hypothetical protein
MMHRALIPTTLVVLCGSSPRLAAQAPADTARQLAEVAREVVRIGERNRDAIWPSFRPDTIPLSFVLPSRGDFLMNWHGPLPPQYTAVADVPGVAWRQVGNIGAASTATMLGGHRVAQVAVTAIRPALLTATAVHEAFHVFEAASRTPGRKFGQGENAALVSTYPVFDTDNESKFAIEGKLLAAAQRAQAGSERRELGREFVAIRRDRHRRLPVEFAEFDQLSELNEGLAEYALVRTLQFIVADGPAGWRAEAQRNLDAHLQLLDHLTESDNLSLRFRFYQTGPAIGLLLDDLAGASWKSHLVDSNETLQDALAAASGIDDAEMAARGSAERRLDAAAIRASAQGQIDRLKLARRAKVDSLLSQPGLTLVLAADSLPGKDFNSCGYDPQNLLAVSPGVNIQMRWWKPCAGGPTYAEFNVPSVHDEAHGTVSAAIGDPLAVTLTSGGQTFTIKDGETLRDVKAFKLNAPRASVEAVRADLLRRGNVLEIHPKR